MSNKHKVELNNQTILVTGAAGFIGSNLSLRLLKECQGSTVIGLDNLNDYNPVAMKEWRLSKVCEAEMIYGKENGTKWIFEKVDLADKAAIDRIFKEHRPSVVVNLAAQAGVRHSIENPYAYLNSNLVGFLNVLEACRHDDHLEHLVYASSSSVYSMKK